MSSRNGTERSGGRRLLRRMRREERGISLIETVITAALLSVVIGAVLSLSETSAKVVPRDTERAAVMAESQVGLYRMTRELRTASSIVSVTDYRFDGWVKSPG